METSMVGWDSYFANVNDELASLFVDLGVRDSAPDPRRPHLTWFWLYLKAPRPDGLSNSEEAPLLGNIEDELVSSLQDLATFVGRITTAGRREFYFYSEEPARCEDAITRTMHNHTAYRFDIGTVQDESWSHYLDLLYPSPEELQRIKNRRVVEVLEQRGDQLAKVRPVSHWAYFPTPEDRNAFMTDATAKGFTIADKSSGTHESSLCLHGVMLEKVDSIDQIDEVTIELFRLAQLHNGKYDGWETVVEKAP